MTFFEQLIERLQAAQGDTHAQAAIAAEFGLLARPEAEREPLRAALDAAAVLHWFDASLLAQVLAIPEEDARKRFEVLKPLPFVERYRRGERHLLNIHEATRLGWRKQLAKDAPDRFRVLSAQAAKQFTTDPTPAGRIEWIYHLLCADPEQGATQLEDLDRNWTSYAHPEDYSALSSALGELVDSALVEGQARAWALLSIAWTRDSRGETTGLTSIAAELLQLARSTADQRAEGDTQCLVGAVLEAQGKLAEAHAAFGKYLAISRRLAAQDPNNAGWQRDLAAAHNRVGGVLEAQGKLAEAQAAFGEDLAISRRLAAQDPNNAGWQRDLAAAHNRVGGVLEAQGKLAEAQAAFGEDLAISRRLAAQDPNNASWQRDLAVAHNWVGGVLEAQGKLAEAQAAFGEYLAISRRLAAQDPSHTGWQRELAVAHNRVGGVLEAQGKLAEAQVAFGEDLAISRRLAAQDPNNAGWQRDLAVAHGRVGEVLEAQGKLAEAQATFGEALAISRRLAAQDPNNAGWQRGLAVAHNRVGGVLKAQGKLAEAQAAFGEYLAISRSRSSSRCSSPRRWPTCSTASSAPSSALPGRVA